MKINEIYNSSKKKDFIYKSRANRQIIADIIDPQNKYLKNEDRLFFGGSYIDNLFLQYFNSEYRDELIKVSNDGQFITFPKPNSNNYYVLKKKITDQKNKNFQDKEYDFKTESSKDNILFNDYPELLGNTNIDIKIYDGYHNNNLMDLKYFKVKDFVKHIFNNEHLYGENSKRYPDFIRNEYKRFQKLQDRLEQCIQLRLEQFANNPKEKMLHFINDMKQKSGCIEIIFPFLVDNKLVEYPMMIMCEYNQEEKYYEPRTILHIPGIFPKTLVYEGLDHETMTLEARTKANEAKTFLNKVYALDKYTGIDLLNPIQLEKYYQGTLNIEKSPLLIDKDIHYANSLDKMSIQFTEDEDFDFDSLNIRDILIYRYKLNKEILTNHFGSSSEALAYKEELRKQNNIIENFYKLSKEYKEGKSYYINEEEKYVPILSKEEEYRQFNYTIQDICDLEEGLEKETVISRLNDTPLVCRNKAMYYKEVERNLQEANELKEEQTKEKELER